MSPYEPRPEGLNTQPAPPSVVETLKPQTWHQGPPPHVGWWNANSIRSQIIWRWWDGERWSMPATDSFGPAAAAIRANRPYASDNIEWTDYWPENARAPRIKPNKVKA